MKRAILSIRLAFVPAALLGSLLVVLFVMNRAEASHDARHAMGVMFLLGMFVAAPVVHLTGLIFGLLGLRGERRALAVTGILLNIVVPIVGLVLALIISALPKLGAFR